MTTWAPFYGHVDGRMRGLVTIINRIPGMQATGSCGGHEDPSPDQRPEGEFYVNFEPVVGDDGWKAIAMLACAVQQFPNVVIDVSYDAGEYPDLTLVGWDRADPAAVERAIGGVLREWNG